jgi:hypothetical protein
MDDGERTARQYDAMAADYAADNAISPFNAFYERPATMALLWNVTGLRLRVGDINDLASRARRDCDGHGREPRDARSRSTVGR